MKDEYRGEPLQDFEKPGKIVTRLTEFIQSGSVLDLGAGNGRNAFYLADKGFNVVAVENDKEKLGAMTEKNALQSSKIEIIDSDVLVFDPRQQFDVIICAMVLHFFSPENVASMIQKMQQWTKGGGYNVITAYSDKNDDQNKRPYLFKHDELPSFYKDWEITSYKEGLTPWFVKPPGTPPRRNHGVYLIAKKKLINY